MNYDVIVIGGGHAGIEAALAPARMGLKTALFTTLVEQIGAASCNPAIGGLAKGHLVKELDALGGEMGLATDATGIQFRILNASKGPAVRGSRAQIDMDRYRLYMRTLCLNTPNLTVRQEMIESLIIAGDAVAGVVSNLGNRYSAKKVIITTGTFLNGLIHIGQKQIACGRAGEFPSVALGNQLRDLGFEVGRLKTGTCARIAASSIDFSAMELHDGDYPPPPFSFRTDKSSFNPKQLPCFVTYTNENTHKIIESNFHRAPLFSGQIEGVGPRYCPSIEDKINRFRDKERHQIFVEPQTLEATEYYLNGLSTSLPTDVQIDMIRSIKGLENAEIVRFGYAIEYDFVQPTSLRHTLETKKIRGLYLAGQINGTTGYEEAAAQGLMAGINAALSVKGQEPLVFRRDEAYIGVLIDDLVVKGTNEPYRMFTSRAEYRLLLREDNADLRLSHYGHKIGLINDAIIRKVEQKREEIQRGVSYLKENFITPSIEGLKLLESLDEEKVNDKTPLLHIAARPSFDERKLDAIAPSLAGFCQEAKEQILIEAKYAPYIQKQQQQIEKMKEMINLKIPADFPFEEASGLSREVVEKLRKHRPETLFEASEISGITPAALDILQMYLKFRCKIQ